MKSALKGAAFNAFNHLNHKSPLHSFIPPHLPNTRINSELTMQLMYHLCRLAVCEITGEAFMGNWIFDFDGEYITYTTNQDICFLSSVFLYTDFHERTDMILVTGDPT